MISHPEIVIIELGSQYTLVIERTLRELGYRSAILSPSKAEGWLAVHPASLVILSGSAASVHDADAPQPPENIFTARNRKGEQIAILGICYGMQWLTHRLGGEVRASGRGEYARTELSVYDPPNTLFLNTPRRQIAWMSHGDSVTRLPEGFSAIAYSTEEMVLTAIEHASKPWWGVQFHPEVTHTEYGKTILGNVLKAAGCARDWSPRSMIDDIRGMTTYALKGRKAIFGMSGGVDSTTLGALVRPALKPGQLMGVLIDGGQLRAYDAPDAQNHAQAANVTLLSMDERKEFAWISGTTDAEKKRARFKKSYARVFSSTAKAYGAETFLQGTLAPDLIESGATGGAKIKSHHNVGLSIKGLEQFHPLSHLFKYEVRALAKELGLPESVWKRQPFPGPGLFIRVVGTPATPEKLELVSWADLTVRRILEAHGLYDSLSQLVVGFAGLDTTGVKGDGRAYKGSILIRAVETSDFMTAEGVWFPKEAVQDIKRRIGAHAGAIRVWFDPTDKPPATTEFE